MADDGSKSARERISSVVKKIDKEQRARKGPANADKPGKYKKSTIQAASYIPGGKIAVTEKGKGAGKSALWAALPVAGTAAIGAKKSRRIPATAGSTAGGAVGGIAGGAIGAAVGGPMGLVAGKLIGASAGASAGAYAGHKSDRAARASKKVSEGISKGVDKVTSAPGIRQIKKKAKKAIHNKLESHKRSASLTTASAFAEDLKGSLKGKSNKVGNKLRGYNKGRRLYTTVTSADSAVKGAKKILKDRGMTKKAQLMEKIAQQVAEQAPKKSGLGTAAKIGAGAALAGTAYAAHKGGLGKVMKGSFNRARSGGASNMAAVGASAARSATAAPGAVVRGVKSILRK